MLDFRRYIGHERYEFHQIARLAQDVLHVCRLTEITPAVFGWLGEAACFLDQSASFLDTFSSRNDF
jgi:hypothetical protein